MSGLQYLNSIKNTSMRKVEYIKMKLKLEKKFKKNIHKFIYSREQ